MPDGPHFELSDNVRGLQVSPTIAIQQRCAALAAEGREVWRMGLGQSPFPVPEPVVAALRAHAREKDYLPTRGLPALCDALAGYLRRTQSLDCTGSDVLIGPGSKELLFLLQVAFEGEILIPSPAWVSYAPQAQVLHRRVRWLHTRPEDGWKLRAADLDAACDGSGPRLLVLNYPNNPTGAAYSEDELREIAAVARRRSVVVLSDEIYGELRYDAGHVSLARYWPEGTIVSTGLSKWCGAGGWRLGAFVFPRPLRPLLEAMSAIASETYTATSAPIQYAAVSAFEPDVQIDAYLLDVRRILAALAESCVQRLERCGAAVVKPAGAFYLFPDFEAHRMRLHRRGIVRSPALCERLLGDTGVACLPGSAFGRPPEELTLRLALVDFDGAAALAESSGEEPMSEAFLLRRCPRVIEAVDRIAAWVSE